MSLIYVFVFFTVWYPSQNSLHILFLVRSWSRLFEILTRQAALFFLFFLSSFCPWTGSHSHTRTYSCILLQKTEASLNVTVKQFIMCHRNLSSKKFLYEKSKRFNGQYKFRYFNFRTIHFPEHYTWKFVLDIFCSNLHKMQIRFNYICMNECMSDLLSNNNFMHSSHLEWNPK